MTATEIARRSDSLYYDSVSRRFLCDRIAYLEADKDKVEQPMTIKTMLDDGAFLPERAHGTDAGEDIRTPYGFAIPAGGTVIVKTGIHVQLPPRSVGMVKSKSGLHIRDGITTEGVIDEGYSGEIVVKLHNRNIEPRAFKRGDKIAQLVVMPVLYPTYVESDSIEAGERGDNGFGSTGR